MDFKTYNHNFRKFNNNILNNLKNPLSNKNGAQSLRFKSNWPIDKQHQPEANIKQDIKFETLDNYIRRIDNKVDLIKIDVDGYEYKIFRGARNLLTTHRPIIIAEIGHATERVGERVEEMIEFLAKLEYKFHSIKDPKQIILDPMARIQSLPHNSSMNVLLLPE